MEGHTAKQLQSKSAQQHPHQSSIPKINISQQALKIIQIRLSLAIPRSYAQSNSSLNLPQTLNNSVLSQNQQAKMTIQDSLPHSSENQKSVSQIQSEEAVTSTSGLPNQNDGLEEFSQHDLDCFVQNILKASQSRLDNQTSGNKNGLAQTLPLKTSKLPSTILQRNKKNEQNAINLDASSDKLTYEVKKQAKLNTTIFQNRSSIQLTTQLARKIQPLSHHRVAQSNAQAGNRPITSKNSNEPNLPNVEQSNSPLSSCIFFNYSLIPPQEDKTAQEEPNSGTMVNTSSNQGSFNTFFNQNFHRASQRKKPSEVTVIQITSDQGQKESEGNNNRKSQTSAVNSEQFNRLEKSENKLSRPTIQGKSSLISTTKDNTKQKPMKPNYSSLQQFYRQLIQIKQVDKPGSSVPSFNRNHSSANKKTHNQQLVLQIKNKIINNTLRKPSQQPKPQKPKNNELYMQRLKQKLRGLEHQEPKKDKNQHLEKNIKQGINQKQLPDKTQEIQHQMTQVRCCITINLLPSSSQREQSPSQSNISKCFETSGPKRSINLTQQKLLSKQIEQTQTNGLQLGQQHHDYKRQLGSSMMKALSVLKNASKSEFIERRMLDGTGIIDLGVLSLEQVVQQCFNYKIISQEIYTQFIAFYSDDKIQYFLKLFSENKLMDWNFHQSKITIMDHRRLSQLLVRSYPKRYKICAPLALNRDICLFLRNLYSLRPEDYNKMCNVMDEISKLQLWKRLSLKYKYLQSRPVQIKQAIYSAKPKIENTEKDKISKGVSARFEAKQPDKSTKPIISQRLTKNFWKGYGKN